ncbi:MAG TPA: NADH-quinone oxidoreductase subunit NuoH [Cyclobacteriaceae bacterium]|nr:NADH-quinone oxidoreductase subunit NuoH [Cyclobacteriaceae bacterium]
MPTLLFILPFLIFYLVMVVYAERKISAFMQDRLGPMEVGYYGLLQTIADLLKLLQKEDIVPARADKILFKAAPILIFIAIFAGFSVLPLSATWSGSGMQTGVFFLLAIISLDVVGIIMAGWASGNKYSSLGAFRAVAQIVSYEVPLTLSVLCVAMFNSTLDLQKISFAQQSQLGIVGWNVIQMPFLFVAWIIFFISSLAESNRAPFDLPEAESELVAGFHTEYSGFRWAIVMLAEYAMMLLVSMLGAVLFFGSWNTPFPNIGSFELATMTTGPVWGVAWLVLKTVILTIVQIWVRWTYPRVRIDQLMSLSWKYLTPAALILVIITGFWKLWLS